MDLDWGAYEDQIPPQLWSWDVSPHREVWNKKDDTRGGPKPAVSSASHRALLITSMVPYQMSSAIPRNNQHPRGTVLLVQRETQLMKVLRTQAFSAHHHGLQWGKNHFLIPLKNVRLPSELLQNSVI